MARTQTTRGSQAPGFAAGRGVLIVLFAAAVGVLLLAKAVDDDDGDGGATGAGATTTTVAAGDPAASSTPDTAPPTTPVPTVPPAKPPAEVVVLVANGRGVAGAAKANADALAVQNYNIAAPTDYTTTDATKVYYLPDYQADAVAVAQALTIDASAATAMPAEGLPIDVKDAMVVVVLGTDGQGLAPS